jgi:cytochrome c peroxidase
MARAFFWDGRAASLERQAIEPIFNPIELGMTEAELEARLHMKTQTSPPRLPVTCAPSVRGFAL